MAVANISKTKMHFSQCLSFIAKNKINLTQKYAEIIKPASKNQINPTTPEEAVKGIRKLRKNVKLGKNLSLKQLIETGRR